MLCGDELEFFGFDQCRVLGRRHVRAADVRRTRSTVSRSPPRDEIPSYLQSIGRDAVAQDRMPIIYGFTRGGDRAHGHDA